MEINVAGSNVSCKQGNVVVEIRSWVTNAGCCMHMQVSRVLFTQYK